MSGEGLAPKPKRAGTPTLVPRLKLPGQNNELVLEAAPRTVSVEPVPRSLSTDKCPNLVLEPAPRGVSQEQGDMAVDLFQPPKRVSSQRMPSRETGFRSNFNVRRGTSVDS